MATPSSFVTSAIADLRSTPAARRTESAAVMSSVVAGAAGGAPEREAATDDDITAALAVRLAAGVDRKSAITEVTKELGVPKRAVYDAALRLRDE
ncbi:MAG TPA: hypothetical protein VFK42_18380 [Acidimicrobiales bacterium]|nr:hypothetical protein [Acidimicrobiales bacterium]